MEDLLFGVEESRGRQVAGDFAKECSLGIDKHDPIVVDAGQQRPTSRRGQRCERDGGRFRRDFLIRAAGQSGDNQILGDDMDNVGVVKASGDRQLLCLATR